MKKILSLLVLIGVGLSSCAEDLDDNILTTAKTNFTFTHNWDGTAVTQSDFNSIQFTNANGEQLSIERLRYLISDVTFTKPSGESIVFEDYNLVDLSINESLAYNPVVNIPTGFYTDVAFTFGFNNADNIDGAYLDLNSTSWNVPAMMGGGYHYMQFDGKFINNSSIEEGFNYHAIRAVDNPGPAPTFPQDTFFTVHLGAVSITKDTAIEIKMNIAEWFKNPNQWDLNTLNTVLMPNSAAQIMMHDNGQTVFSLGTVTN